MDNNTTEDAETGVTTIVLRESVDNATQQSVLADDGKSTQSFYRIGMLDNML